MEFEEVALLGWKLLCRLSPGRDSEPLWVAVVMVDMVQAV